MNVTEEQCITITEDEVLAKVVEMISKVENSDVVDLTLMVPSGFREAFALLLDNGHLATAYYLIESLDNDIERALAKKT